MLARRSVRSIVVEKWVRSATLGPLHFYPNKQITTGEGGAIVTNSSDIASKVRSLRNQGVAAPGSWLAHSDIGYNYRISEINCALGISQLNRVDEILEA